MPCSCLHEQEHWFHCDSIALFVIPQIAPYYRTLAILQAFEVRPVGLPSHVCSGITSHQEAEYHWHYHRYHQHNCHYTGDHFTSLWIHHNYHTSLFYLRIFLSHLIYYINFLCHIDHSCTSIDWISLSIVKQISLWPFKDE